MDWFEIITVLRSNHCRDLSNSLIPSAALSRQEKTHFRDDIGAQVSNFRETLPADGIDGILNPRSRYSNFRAGYGRRGKYSHLDRLGNTTPPTVTTGPTLSVWCFFLWVLFFFRQDSSSNQISCKRMYACQDPLCIRLQLWKFKLTGFGPIFSSLRRPAKLFSSGTRDCQD